MEAISGGCGGRGGRGGGRLVGHTSGIGERGEEKGLARVSAFLGYVQAGLPLEWTFWGEEVCVRPACFVFYALPLQVLGEGQGWMADVQIQRESRWIWTEMAVPRVKESWLLQCLLTMYFISV